MTLDEKEANLYLSRIRLIVYSDNILSEYINEVF